MEKIIVNWNNIPIVDIFKRDERYFSHINYDNLKLAEQEGLFVPLFSGINVISKELPVVIMDRIPKAKVREDILKQHNVNHDVDDIEYLKITKGRLFTDRITVDII